MRIVLSRKGFDTASGGGPSPIVDGRPVSLPIPDSKGLSPVTYGALGLGALVARASGGRLGAGDACHHDPLFTGDGRAILGQCHAAEGHLARQGVGVGDVFLFFGLFDSPEEGRHHRIFGYLEVAEVIDVATADAPVLAPLRALGHPHAFGLHAGNDRLYLGPGAAARRAPAGLRLTAPGARPSLWRVPGFFARTGLSYHANPARWGPEGQLNAASRGQEFVADVGADAEARAWLAEVIAAIAAA